MKTKIFTLGILLLLFASFASAQEVDTIPYDSTEIQYDTTRVRLNKHTIVKIITEHDNTETCDSDSSSHGHGYLPPHWAGFGLSVNTLVSPSGDFNYSNDPNLDLNYGKSWSFNLNFAQFSLPIIKNNFGLVTGLGFSFKNYRFIKSNLTLTKTDTLGYFLDQTQSYKKSKLTTASLIMPILFQIRTNKDYYLLFGGYGTLLMASHSKQKSGEGDKLKNKGFTYLTTINYGAMIRLGHRDFSIFATYSLLPVFKKDRGPEAYQLDFGFQFDF